MDATSPALPCPHRWADQVAARADLPDRRLNARFARVLAALAAKPLDPIPQACPSAGQAKAAYRFLGNDRFAAADLLAPLAAATAEACRGRPVVLAVQDTTSLHFPSAGSAAGLGKLNDSDARGLQLHTTLAVTTDGVPLGLLHQSWWGRPPDERTARHRWNRPTEAKETRKWLGGVAGSAAALAALPAGQRPRLVHVLDRGGDLHDVFEHVRAAGHGAVVRCLHDRRVAGPVGKAHRAVAAAPRLGVLAVDVPARHGRPRRRARLELRSVPLTLRPSRKHPHERRRRPVTLSLVEAREVSAPAGVEPLHWRLWTTEPAARRADAARVVALYRLRWRVEDFHLTLKSGCRAEALGLGAAERLAKAVTLYSAAAVRILALRELARRAPDAPCTCVLGADAWRALWVHTHGRPLPAGAGVPTVREAVRWIGRLGGHLGRKCDGMPGVRTLWRGWRDLALLAAGYRAAREAG